MEVLETDSILFMLFCLLCRVFRWNAGTCSVRRSRFEEFVERSWF